MPGARTLAKEMDDPGTAQKFRGFVLSQLVKLHGDRWSVWGGPAEHMLLLSYTTRDGNGKGGLYPIRTLAATNDRNYGTYPLEVTYVSAGANGYLQSTIPGWEEETHAILALTLVNYAVSMSGTAAGTGAGSGTLYSVVYADGSTSMFSLGPDGKPHFLAASDPVGVDCPWLPPAPIPPSDDRRYQLIGLSSRDRPESVTEYLSLILGQMSRP